MLPVLASVTVSFSGPALTLAMLWPLMLGGLFTLTRKMDDAAKARAVRVVVAIGAVASVAIATRYYLQARDDFDVADSAVDYQLVDRARNRGGDRLLIAQLTGAAAVSLAAGAVVRFVLHRPTSVEVTATPTAVGLRAQF